MESRHRFKVTTSGGPKISCLLLENKCDLVQLNEKDKDVIRESAEQNGFIYSLYTSPKKKINIEEAAKEIIRRDMHPEENPDRKDTIDVINEPRRKKII